MLFKDLGGCCVHKLDDGVRGSHQAEALFDLPARLSEPVVARGDGLKTLFARR